MGKSYHRYSPSPSIKRVLSIFMSPQSWKLCIVITIHHHFHEWIKHQTLVIDTLDIPAYTIHILIMWCLGVISKLGALINRKGNISSFVWFQIQNHSYNRSILFALISLIPRTIVVCTKSWLNIGGCWKPIAIIYTCGFQYFAYKSILTKLIPPLSNVLI